MKTLFADRYFPTTETLGFIRDAQDQQSSVDPYEGQKMFTTVRFRRTAGVGPQWMPERFRSRRYEVKGEAPERRIVDLEELSELCGGGRNTDFQQCLSMATRLAIAGDPRWISYPSIAVVDE
mgnify:CR=1 FL=1